MANGTESYWQKLSILWPVIVGLILVGLALAETRWRVQHLWDVKQAEQAANEKLQWEGIAALNKHTTQMQAWIDRYEQRLGDDTYRDWVAWRAEKDQTDDNIEARVERLERNWQ